MNHALVAEGGYQAFHIAGADWTWLIVAMVAGVVGIATGLILAHGVLAADTGDPQDPARSPKPSRRGPRRS